MMRARASASATREVSIVIQRRPHCSATVGRRAGAAGRVEHEVAGVGGHEDAALNDLRDGLNDIDFGHRILAECHPNVLDWLTGSRR